MDPNDLMSSLREVDSKTDKIAAEIVDAAFKVHQTLGPGLLESAYEACLAYEINRRGLKVEQQLDIPLNYGEVQLNAGFRLDLLIESLVIVEIKAVELILPIHQAQIITYLRLARKNLGFLINFNVRFFKKGLERVVLSKSLR